MAEVRACFYSLVLLVIFQRTLGTPTFGSGLWCSLFCDSDYEDDSSSASFEDLLVSLFDPCDGCDSPSPAAPERPSPAAETPSETTTEPPKKIELSIPPANGVNLTLENTGTSWWVNLIPWIGSGSATPTTAAPAAAAAPTPAANETAANATAA